jgi:hypothetical protein
MPRATDGHDMDVHCEGCAGCCLDWRPIAPETLDHERRGPRPPLDDAYNLVPLTRDEIVRFLDAGYGDAMRPRLWRAKSDDESVEIDGVDVAAIGGRPVFFVGLRKSPKPVAPFDTDPAWLDTCAFLDPETLQCRIHGDDLYPGECAEYPGHNLSLGKETECERVETAYGGERLLDDAPPEDPGRLLLGPQAIGAKLFVHPDPGRLGGVVDRLVAGDLDDADRAEFVGVAVGSSPGSRTVDQKRATQARSRALEADSWVGRAATEWDATSGDAGASARDAPTGEAVEERRGAPETPGW